MGRIGPIEHVPPASATGAGSLARAARGGIWAAGSWFVRFAVVIASGVALRAFVGPEAFGIVAFASVILDFLIRIHTWGFDEALLHRPDDERLIAAHFGWQVRLAGIVAALAFAIAIVGRKFGLQIEPLHVLVVLALSEIARVAGSTPRVLMEKEFRFTAVSMAETVATVLSYAGALLVAWLWPEYGLWALVGQRVAEIILRTASFWLIRPVRVHWEIDRATTRWLFLEFGWPMWIGSVAFVVTFRLPDFLVGKWAGFATLGIFFTAERLATVPRDLITFLPRVLMPVFGRLQHDRAAMADVFEKVQGTLMRAMSIFVVAVVVLVPDLLTLCKLSPRWDAMVPIFRVLAPYGLCYALFAAVPSLAIVGLGMPKLHSKVQVYQGICVVVLGTALIWGFAAMGAAIALNVMMVTSTVAIWWMVSRHVPIRFGRILIPPAVASAVALGAGFGMSYALRELTAAVRAPLVLLGVLAAYAAVLAAWEGRRLLRQFAAFRALLFSRAASP